MVFIIYTDPRELRDKRKRHRLATLSARPQPIYLDPKRIRVLPWLKRGGERMQLSKQSPIVLSELHTTNIQSLAHLPEEEKLYTPEQPIGSCIDPFTSLLTGMNGQAAKAIHYCENLESLRR